MKPRRIATLIKDAADVRSGKVAPGRVWVVNKRADGTVERKQVDAAEYQRQRQREQVEPPFLALHHRGETAEYNPVDVVGFSSDPEVLIARRRMGVSQDRFAELLGIRPATLRNWEQGRCKLSGPAKVLVRVLLYAPDTVVKAVNKSPLAEHNKERTPGVVAVHLENVRVNTTRHALGSRKKTVHRD